MHNLMCKDSAPVCFLLRVPALIFVPPSKKHVQLYLRLPHCVISDIFTPSGTAHCSRPSLEELSPHALETALCCASGPHGSIPANTAIPVNPCRWSGKPTPDAHPLVCSYGSWAPAPHSSVSHQDQVCLIPTSRRNSYFSPRHILKDSKFTFSLNKEE